MIASISEIKHLLDKYNLKAKKKYGQNFLISQNVVNKVIDKIDENEEVIEIGPGLGSLTYYLCQKAKKVTAYEIDEDLYHILKEEMQFDNFVLYNQDFLKVDVEKLNDNITVVSNLPYYITTQLLTMLFMSHQKINKIIAMMQKEVANRFLSKEKNKDYNYLQVLAQLFSTVELVSNVNSNNFYPSPNVDSIILEFNICNKYLISDEKKLIEIIKASFNQRRKTIYYNLNSCGFKITQQQLLDISINPLSRVEQLEIEDYIKLCEVIK